MRSRRLVWCVVFALACVLASTPAFARNLKKFADAPDNTMKLHQHIRPFGFPSALLSTNVGVYLGYSYAELAYADKVDFALFKEDRFKLAGLVQVIDFEAKMHDRFSTEFLISGSLNSGADDRSALIFGGQGLYAISAIPKVNLVRNDKWGTAVSLGVALDYDQGVQSSPFALMIQVLENVNDFLTDLANGEVEAIDEDTLEDLVEIKLADALTTTTTTTASPMILYTQTIVPALGVQASLRYDYGINEDVDSPNEEDTGDPPTGWFFGGLVVYDFYRVSKAAFGLRAEGFYESEENDETTSKLTTYAGGILFTGRRSLDLGMTVSYQQTQVDFGDDIIPEMNGDSYTLLLNMKYYF